MITLPELVEKYWDNYQTYVTDKSSGTEQYFNEVIRYSIINNNIYRLYSTNSPSFYSIAAKFHNKEKTDKLAPFCKILKQQHMKDNPEYFI